jgi:DNA-binding SARP family transcriptional activator
VLLYQIHENPPALVEDCLEKLLQIDPYNEQFMCMLLDYYRKKRQVKQMVDRYRDFHKSVKEELGVDLQQSTIDFFNECHYRVID